MAKEKDCQNCGDAKTMNDFCKSLVTIAKYNPAGVVVFLGMVLRRMNYDYNSPNIMNYDYKSPNAKMENSLFMKVYQEPATQKMAELQADICRNAADRYANDDLVGFEDGTGLGMLVGIPIVGTLFILFMVLVGGGSMSHWLGVFLVATIAILLLATMWASSRAELKKYKERYFKVPEDW